MVKSFKALSGLESPFLTSYTYWIVVVSPQEISSIFKTITAFLCTISRGSSVVGRAHLQYSRNNPHAILLLVP